MTHTKCHLSAKQLLITKTHDVKEIIRFQFQVTEKDEILENDILKTQRKLQNVFSTDKTYYKLLHPQVSKFADVTV